MPPMAQGDDGSNNGGLRALHECNGTPLSDGLIATRGSGTYQLHCVVVVVTWRRCLPVGLGLRLRLRVGLRRCWGLRLPGVPHVRRGLREKRMVQFSGWSTHISYLSFSADGLHRRLHMSATCPFRRMVCTGSYTCLLLVVFCGWSAGALTHVSYLSFSADGLHRRHLHMSPTCPFRRMVCTGPYMSPTCPFGEWSAQAITRTVLTLHPAPYIA